MAERVEVFDATITAGTAEASPSTAQLVFPPGDVERVQLVIPDGAAGQVGIALAQAGQPIIPRAHGAFLTGNDEVIDWPLEGFLNTGNWQLVGFNTDVFDHTIQVRFLVNEIGRARTGFEPGPPPPDIGPIEPPPEEPPPEEPPPDEELPPEPPAPGPPEPRGPQPVETIPGWVPPPPEPGPEPQPIGRGR